MSSKSHSANNSPNRNSNPGSKGCFIYTRVSTDRQADEGYSLDEQEKSCRESAQRMGYKVLGIYREEGASGTSINRPKFREMLERCSDDEGKNIKAVIVIHTDRFARNTLEHLMVKGILQKHNVKLVSVLQSMLDDSPEGNLLDVILAGMNEFYSKDLGRKTSRALMQKISEGWWPGFAPFGYVNMTHPETGFKTIQPDKDKSYFIKETFKRFASNKYTVESLNKELYLEGFRSRTGKKMHKSRMSALLRNIFYTGKMNIKDKIYQGKHAPLVDMATYLKVQKILDQHNHKASRKRKHNFLLNGLLFCQECQSQLTGEKHVKNSGLVFDYYRCMGPKHDKTDCRQAFTPAGRIEEDIDRLFKNITVSSDYMNALKIALEEIYKFQNQKSYGWIKALENKKTAILGKMDKLEDLLLEDVMDRNRIIKKYTMLKEELGSIENRISEMKYSGQKLKKEDIDKILNFVRTFGKTYGSLNPGNKKLFLKLLISKVFLKDKKVTEVTYTPIFRTIMEKDLVRIGSNWLRVRDLIRTLEIVLTQEDISDITPEIMYKYDIT